MARAAIAVHSETSDPLQLKSAVATLATRMDILAVGPWRNGSAAIVVKTDIGPYAIARIIERSQLKADLIAYGSLVLRSDGLTLPRHDSTAIDSLLEADPGFELP